MMSTEEPAVTEAQRMVNMGLEFESKKLGRKVIVRELPLESIIRCLSELSKVMVLFPTSGGDPGSVLKMLLESGSTAGALRVFAAESTGTAPVDWIEAPVSDWVKFIRCAKRVNDIEEIKQLFTEMGLDSMMKSQQAPVSLSDESPTRQRS